MATDSVSPRFARWLLGGLVGLTILLFLPSLGVGFVFDDMVVIPQNPTVTSLSHWTEWFTGPYWPQEGGFGLYRPLILASYALTWAAVGATPWVFHLTNVLAHALVTALVWWVGRRIGLSAVAALLAALLFAVHPVHVEVVAAVVNRTDSFVAAPMLLAVGIHCLTGPYTWRRAAAVLACFVLALGCKESALLLPALLLAAEITLTPARWRDANSRAPLVGLAASMVALIALYVVAVVHFCGRFGFSSAAAAFPNTTIWDRLGVIPWVIGQYARLLLWPMRLSPDYGHALPAPTAARQVLGLLLLAVLVGGGLVAVLILRRRHPPGAFALLWVGLAMAPYLHIIRGGAVVAERFAYLASVGLCWAVSALCQPLPSRHRTIAPSHCRTFFVLIIATLFAGRSLRETLLWRHPLALWESAVATGLPGWIGWQNLGIERLRAGDGAGALEAFEQVERLGVEEPEVRQMMAMAQLSAGNPAAAERTAREALARWPGHEGLTTALSQVLLQTGRADEALPLLTEGVEAHPESPYLWVNLAFARLETGDLAGARAAFARAESLGIPDSATIRSLRAALSANRAVDR